MVEFRSDITEVVYVNYLVPVARWLRFVPPGFRCSSQAGGPRWACLRLTYRHGDFEAGVFQTLRRLCGSRCSLTGEFMSATTAPANKGLLRHDAVTTALCTPGARPDPVNRYADAFRAVGDPRRRLAACKVVLEPGTGQRPGCSWIWSSADRSYGPWAQCFADCMPAMLHYAVPQNRAPSTLPADLRTVRRRSGPAFR